MIYHVLNGDGLAGHFDLEGEIVVCREALIEGDLMAPGLDDFWKVRAKFFNDDSYLEKVKSEFDKLGDLKPTDEVNFWFGDEAFCQVNLWFVLSLLADKDAAYYRVFPDSNNWDCLFNDSKKCFESRQKLSGEDIQLGKQLWKAFYSGGFDDLKYLGQKDSPNFKNLEQICHALIEKDIQPKEILQEITKTGETDFGKIFSQFREKAGVYGFGDDQVKNLLNEI